MMDLAIIIYPVGYGVDVDHGIHGQVPDWRLIEGCIAA
jgi:hypothetical protein